jgi:hypothetical protein
MVANRFVIFGLAAVVLSASGAAHAAVLDAIQGAVLVNGGGGYRVVKGSMQLKPGYSVMANRDGRAIVSYSDGCNVPVEPGSVVTVAQSSPCSARAGYIATGSNGANAPAPGGWDASTVGVGALAVAGVVGAAAFIAHDRDSDRRPGRTLPPTGGENPTSP